MIPVRNGRLWIAIITVYCPPADEYWGQSYFSPEQHILKLSSSSDRWVILSYYYCFFKTSIVKREHSTNAWPHDLTCQSHISHRFKCVEIGERLQQTNMFVPHLWEGGSVFKTHFFLSEKFKTLQFW